jgi:hypothetical protein
MVKFLKFASETPNKSKAFRFAATKRWSTSVTTTASRALASNFRKSFSLVRSALRSLRGLSTARRPSLVSVVWACRRCGVTLTKVASCALHFGDFAAGHNDCIVELASRSFLLRGVPAAIFRLHSFPSGERVLCLPGPGVTCSQVASCALHLAILPLVTTTHCGTCQQIIRSCAKCLL